MELASVITELRVILVFKFVVNVLLINAEGWYEISINQDHI